MKASSAITGIGVFILLVIMTGFSFWKFQDVYLPQKSFCRQGDGIGTMSVIPLYHNYIEKNGFSALIKDKWPTEGIGIEPLTRQHSFYARAIFFISSSFLSPDNSYDTVLILSYIAIFTLSLFLFRAWGISWILTISGAFILANLDNFYARAGGHLLLAGYFAIPLFLGMIFHTAQKPSWQNFALLSASFVLVINTNEYYGYYGGIAGPFTLAILIVYNGFTCKKDCSLYSFKKLRTGLFAAAAVFCILMVISYPIMIGNALGIISPGSDSGGLPHRTYTDFVVYNPTRPLYIFKSTLPFFKTVTNHDLFITKIEEFKTFRIGFMPFIIDAAGLILCIRAAVRKQKTDQKLLVYSLSIYIPCFILFLFTLPLNLPTLAIISYKLGAIFRVGARAYMIIDIFLILLCLIYLDYFQKWLKKSSGTALSTLAVAVIVILIFCDACGFQAFKKFQARTLEDTSIYSSIAGKEKGWLIEYPINYEIVEGNYRYYYHRNFHGMPVINFPYPDHDNQWFIKKYRKLDEAKLKFMHRAGVRYICVTKGLLENFKRPVFPETLKALAQSKYYKQLNTNGRQIIYEARKTSDFGSIDIRGFVYGGQMLSLNDPVFVNLPNFGVGNNF